MGIDYPRNGNKKQPSYDDLLRMRAKRLRCENNHPAWNLYHKRIEGSTETIICCKECEKNAVS